MSQWPTYCRATGGAGDDNIMKNTGRLATINVD